MGFRIFSKIVILLGVVLVLVVIVEFMLLSLYVKEQDAAVVKSTQRSMSHGVGKLDGLIKPVRENSNDFTPAKKESNTGKYQVKSEDTKR